MSDTSNENLDTARKIIETQLQDNWSETPIAFQDVPYKVNAAEEFVALNVLWSGSEGIALQTNGPIRDWGIAMIEVFAIPDEGSSRVLELCGDLRALFNEFVSGGLTFHTGSARRVGVMGDFLKYIVEIPFYYEG
jgi:hypothetical protein